MTCGGELTVAIPTLEVDYRIAFPAESGLLLTDTSLNSSLTVVGALEHGSLSDTFGEASVAALVSRGGSFLRRDVSLGTDLSDLLSVNALITNEVLSFGSGVAHQEDPCSTALGAMVLCRSVDRSTAQCVPRTLCTTFYDADGDEHLLTVHAPRYGASSTLILPNENGTVLTTSSSTSSLETVGLLTSGGIGLGFGGILTASDVNLTNVREK